MSERLFDGDQPDILPDDALESLEALDVMMERQRILEGESQEPKGGFLGEQPLDPDHPEFDDILGN